MEVDHEGGIYNVASGGSTIEERVKGIMEIFNPNPNAKIIYAPEKTNSTQFVLDYLKTVNELGYKPSYTWKDYLEYFKEEMKVQRFKKLWGRGKKIITKTIYEKILILGAANDQLLLISKSKELGYYVIVCDRTTTNPGLKYVDKHYQVDYMDREVVLQIAKVEEVDGIISNSEVVMQNVAYVCEELGLRGNTLESIRNIGEKNLFRKLQNRIGVFAPKQTDVDTMENAIQAIKEMSLPVLIKPCRNSASRGITKIDSFDESLIRKSFENSARDSWNKKVTVEEFVEMPSLTVIEGDIFIYDGKILWDGIFNDQRSSGAPMVPMSDISPLHLSSEKKNVIKDTVAKIVKGAGLEFGQFNIEMYFTKDNQLFVIEINTRQGE